MGTQNEKKNVVIIIDSDDDEIEISERKAIETKPLGKEPITQNKTVPAKALPNHQIPMNTSNINLQRSPSSIQKEAILPTLAVKKPSVNINRLFQKDNRIINLGKGKPKPRPQQSVNILDSLIDSDDSLAEILGNSDKLVRSPLLDRIRGRKTSSASQESPSNASQQELPPSSSPSLHSTFSPDRSMQYQSVLSPNNLDSPPVLSRKRPIASPQGNSSMSRYAMEKQRMFYELNDQDSEEDLESYITYITARRRLFEKEIFEVEHKKTGAMNMQCPLCYLFFPKGDISEHATECDGKKAGKGIQKNTIAAAVAQNEIERKKRNKGIIDIGPINYYADSEGTLALDGINFGSEVTAGLSWESAGQTRFA